MNSNAVPVFLKRSLYTILHTSKSFN